MNNPPSNKDDVESIPPAPLPPLASGVKWGIPLPRLVQRTRIFSQSANDVKVQHQYDRRIFWLMLKYDWFHLFLRGSMLVAIVVLLGLWTGMILVFAGIYRYIDDNDPNKNCGLATPPNVITYHGAFAFSLETCKYKMTNARSGIC
jgi:hypothetical protein